MLGDLVEKGEQADPKAAHKKDAAPSWTAADSLAQAQATPAPVAPLSLEALLQTSVPGIPAKPEEGAPEELDPSATPASDSGQAARTASLFPQAFVSVRLPAPALLEQPQPGASSGKGRKPQAGSLDQLSPALTTHGAQAMPEVPQTGANTSPAAQALMPERPQAEANTTREAQAPLPERAQAGTNTTPAEQVPLPGPSQTGAEPSPDPVVSCAPSEGGTPAMSLAFGARLTAVPVPAETRGSDNQPSPRAPLSVLSRQNVPASSLASIAEGGAEAAITPIASDASDGGRARSQEKGDAHGFAATAEPEATEKDGADKPERQRKPDAPASPETDAGRAMASGGRAVDSRDTQPAGPPPRGDSSSTREAARPEPATPHLRSEPAAPPAAARDITLELNGGDRRVEVRLVERRGDIQVAVRTPDARLAGELREGLPALTAKLEQSGFRAETWHPAASAGERSRLAEPHSAAAQQDAQEQSGEEGRQRQRDHQQDAQDSGQRSGRKLNRKEFAWLFSSLR